MQGKRLTSSHLKASTLFISLSSFVSRPRMGAAATDEAMLWEVASLLITLAACAFGKLETDPGSNLKVDLYTGT